ncbi:hypothetical protein KKE26_08160 [bacterium]|nr:hypothetical protein [bacterium]MBU1752706.1 hypothetical protein [bacterium]
MIKDNKVVAGSFELLLNSSKLPDYIASTIKEVTVEDTINQPAMFTIKIEIGDFIKNMSQEKMDVDIFKPGDEMQISMGFDAPKKMIIGEIISVEPTFQKPFSMGIRGYDRLHRLTSGTKRLSFKKMKDSDIASSIASKIGLTPKVDDTSTVFPYIFQNNQSDYEFLLERANRIGYEMFVEDKTFIFRKPQDNKSPLFTLNYDLELHSFSINMRAVPEGGKVEVRGWDIKNKKEITSTVGGNTGRELLPQKITGKTSDLISDEVVVDAADAENIAQARHDAMLKNVITGEGKCCGNPDIRIGKTVEIKGIGDRLSGKYYVTSSVHTINDEGYATTFKVRKIEV